MASAPREDLFTGDEARGVGEVIPDQYIVLLRNGVAKSGRDSSGPGWPVSVVAKVLAEVHGGQLLAIWDRVALGFLVGISEDGAQRLAKHPWIHLVAHDVAVPLAMASTQPCSETTFSLQNSFTPASPQSISCPLPTWCNDNWGLDRLDQRYQALDGYYTFRLTGRGVHIYLLDSGLSPHHEFYDGAGGWRIGKGINVFREGFAPSDPDDTSDCTGHGTHVAAIAAGRRYGVAKGATVHPVKFIACSQANVTISNIISGLDWISQNHVKPAVVNFSVNIQAGVSNFTGEALAVMEAAFQSLISRDGIAVVNSAGNHNAQAAEYSPTRMNDVIVVAGTTSWDYRMGHPGSDPAAGPCERIDEFGYPRRYDCGASNYGLQVDIFAPAQDILSAWNREANAVCLLTGTSMAAPHVTGVIAQFLEANPTATPAQVQQALVAWATPDIIKGNLGWDTPNRLVYSFD